MPSAPSGLRHPASASCLGRHARLAGRCPNNSSLFPPLAAVVVVASHIQRKKYFKFRVCRALRSAPNAIFTGGVVAGNGSCCACSPGGAVAQRLRGCKSAEPEKTVKRSSRRTGVNLQFFPVQPSALGLKGASSPFFVAPARRNRWHFSGSLLVSKENIPALIFPHRTARTPVR